MSATTTNANHQPTAAEAQKVLDRRRRQRTALAYILLIAGSILFLFPLLPLQKTATHAVQDSLERVETADTGIHLIDLTMGEDPLLFNSDGSGFDRLVELVRVVRHATGVPIMVSPGVIPEDVLPRLVKAGADWYACYQETHQGQLFDQLRPGQDFSLRLETKHKAHGIGMLIEEGLLCGVGETPFDVARSLNVMQQIDADHMAIRTDDLLGYL